MSAKSDLTTVRVVLTESADVDEQGLCFVGPSARGWRVVLERDRCNSCGQPVAAGLGSNGCAPYPCEDQLRSAMYRAKPPPYTGPRVVCHNEKPHPAHVYVHGHGGLRERCPGVVR